MTDDERTRLEAVVGGFANRRVLVVGDLIADEFVYGEIARASREAPVLILRYESTSTVPGGAGNAAANAAALGGSVALVGVVGRDRPGRATILALRQRGVDTKGIVTVANRPTPTKTRILAGLAHSLRQQVIRVDNEPTPLESDAIASRVVELVVEREEWAEVVIVSDYGYGAAGELVARALRETFLPRGVPVIVDSRYRLGAFSGFTSATPNEVELEEIAGAPFRQDEHVVEAAERVVETLELDALLVTRGSQGMVLVRPGAEPVRIPIVGGAEAIDVTGAGDTVIATYALGLAGGASFEEAARVANHAGGLVVMKRGTATLEPADLLASIRS